MRSIKKLIKFIFFLLVLLAIFIAVGVYYPSPKLPDVGFKGLMMVRDVNIVDIQSGQILQQQNVLIDEGRVLNISSENIRPRDKLTIIIEGKDRYLIPALWDMYSSSDKHSPYYDHPMYLTHGITHLRDLSGCLNKDDQFRACNDDKDRWTRLAKTGSQLSPIYHGNTIHPLAGGSEIPEGYPDFLKANQPSKVNALVKFALSKKVDFITINKALSSNVYFGLADEAQKNSFYLAGEIPSNASLSEVLASGQGSIEEPSIFTYACYKDAEKLRYARASKIDSAIVTDIEANQDSLKCQTLMTAMASSDIWWTPSLANLRSKTERRKAKNEFEPLINKYLFDKFFADTSVKSRDISNYETIYQLSKQHLSAAQQVGVRMLAGSNAKANHAKVGLSLHDELSDMVDAGLTPLQALQAATYNPAAFTQESENYGEIEIGKQADFVLLNSNPLIDINNTTDIDAVITQQRYLDKEAIDYLNTYVKDQSKSWHQNIKYFWTSVSSPMQRKVLLDNWQQNAND